MSKKIDEDYVIEQYNNNKSTYTIAAELNTYPNKINRILKRKGCKVRDKSEAQSIALECGRSSHPTRGRKRSTEEKDSISKGVESMWGNKSEKEKKQFKKQAKERWENIPESKKIEMQRMAGDALRRAGIEGSKAEKALKTKLEDHNYDVVLHKKDLLPGQYEIDLFLPQIKTIIEIDGPQHFKPVWGEEQLQRTIKYDQTKNGLLIGAGYCVIRIKYMCKTATRSTGQRLFELVHPHLEKIANKFPTKSKRFIELEINK